VQLISFAAEPRTRRDIRVRLIAFFQLLQEGKLGRPAPIA
jgi:hypothetical protein